MRRMEKITGRSDDMIILRGVNVFPTHKPERPLLMPVTMSLFGVIHWVYMWFRDGGIVSREDYAEVATTLVLEGIMAVR
jgi:Tetracyclin repressor-like, C-terminal domain